MLYYYHLFIVVTIRSTIDQPHLTYYYYNTTTETDRENIFNIITFTLYSFLLISSANPANNKKEKKRGKAIREREFVLSESITNNKSVCLQTTNATNRERDN